MRTLFILPALLLAGCPVWNDKEWDDTGSEAMWPTCDETVQVIGLEDATALGFTAADVLAAATGARSTTFMWSGDQSVADLVIEVVHAKGEIRFVDQEPHEGGNESGMETAMGVECPDSVQLDVQLSFVTSDGGLDENLDSTLVATEAGVAGFGASLEYEALVGSFEMEIPSDATAASVSWSGVIDAKGTSGTVMGEMEGEPGDGTVWASQDPVGVWPAGATE